MRKKNLPEEKRRKKKKEEKSLLRLGSLFLTLFFLWLLWQRKKEILALSRYGYGGIFFVNFFSAATVVFPLPGTVTVFFGGALWYPWLVALSSALGSSLGELSGYFLGFGGRGLVLPSKNLSWNWQKTELFFQKTGFLTTFVFSLLPFPVFDFLGVLAGSLNYPLFKFWLATFSGRLIRNFLIAWTGAKFLPL